MAKEQINRHRKLRDTQNKTTIGHQIQVTMIEPNSLQFEMKKMKKTCWRIRDC